MRNRAVACIGAAVLSLCAMAAAPVTAAASSGSEGPGQLCLDGNLFTIKYTASYPGATGAADGSYLRAIPTTGGCASSWAHGDGQLSTAAIAAQCRTGIEARFGPYPLTLQFAERFVLKNRADCIKLMSAVAHGEVDPGRAPLFPGGAG